MTGRRSGILLPIFSLPGPYGIGCLGAGARAFVDFLSAAGQRYWQILPLVPPGSGDSPYMSPSAFAGNPLFLDLEDLMAQGLLTREELDSARDPNPDRADYRWLSETRIPLLRKAFSRAGEVRAPENCHWLSDYANFMALHDRFGTAWQEWPKDAAPDPEDVRFHIFLQDQFIRQWTALKKYANDKGIRIMGDLPIYVSEDSAEVWASPELFQVDADGYPTQQAGVPPDAFSASGQHWGNPLYDWTGHKKELFSWWAGRMEYASRLYDAVRIDHFRGFHTYWSIPAGETTALKGHWEQGPGQELVDDIRKEVPGLELIAEDLGDLDDKVREFIAGSGLPGMRIMVYAFDPDGESSYMPHNCPPEAVMYTGTHDTPTFVQWLFDEASPRQREFATDYLRLRADEGYGWGAICGAWGSPCALAIAPLQDVLGLGKDARVNFPGTCGPENWSWRVRADGLNADVAARLKKITRTYRRI
ncbi:MAG: 4-alpha-glucanotransferase [Clostridia bacterium]|nr:4-alpha-glucanotransferase [Clostridia bacterium]